MGVVPPRSVIQRVHTEMRGFAGKPVLENLLYVHSAEKIEKLAAIKSAEVVRCAGVIDTGVAPAYLKLILFFEGQLSRSTTDRGSGSCPDGDAYDAHHLRSETTTSTTPQAVHKLGLSGDADRPGNEGHPFEPDDVSPLLTTSLAGTGWGGTGDKAHNRIRPITGATGPRALHYFSLPKRHPELIKRQASSRRTLQYRPHRSPPGHSQPRASAA